MSNDHRKESIKIMSDGTSELDVVTAIVNFLWRTCTRKNNLAVFSHSQPFMARLTHF